MSIHRPRPVRKPRIRVLIVAAVWWLAGNTVGAQVIIEDPVQCAACALEFTVEARIGDRTGPGAIPGPPLSIATDSRGRFWVVFGGVATPLVFGSDGNFIRAVGRQGSGPGEFTLPQIVVRAADSMAIYDRAGRITVVGPDLHPVRTIRMNLLEVLPHAMLVLDWPRAVVVNGRGWIASTSGWPLFALDLSGDQASVRQSFGRDQGTLLPGSERFIRRELAHDPEDAELFWSINRFLTFEFSLWSAEGDDLRYLRRQSEWLPDDAPTVKQGMRGGEDRAPSPRIAAIHEDEDGRLWVVGHVPAPSWRQAWTAARAGEELPDIPRGQYSGVSASLIPASWNVYQSMIELIDPDAAAVVHRQTFAGYVTDMLEDGRLVVYRQTSEGFPYLEIYRATLRGAD